MSDFISVAEVGPPGTEVTDALFWEEWLGDDIDTPTVLEEAARVEDVYKHMPGRHDQKLHDPHKGKGGPIGLKPDAERQARWRAMLDDPETNEFQVDKAIREELEALPGGPEALRQLEKWYYNPGEDMLPEMAEKVGWDPEGDIALLNTLQSIEGGTATLGQVEAMSAIYDYNQAHLRHLGVDNVKVHRGLALDPREAEKLKPGKKFSTALTGHWSADEDISARFAAHVYEDAGDWDFQEVIIHRTFEPAEVFDHYSAHATKFDMYHELQESEVVPVDGTEHTIGRTWKRRSHYTGEEVLHVWVW